MKRRLIISSIIIIIVVFFLFILFFSISYNLKKYKSNNLNNILINNDTNTNVQIIYDKNKYKIEKISNIEDYYILKSCITKYFLITSGYFNTDSQNDKKIYIQNMYSILDNNCLNMYNITENDIVNLMFNSDKYYINIEDIIFFREKDRNFYAYLVRIDLRDMETNEINIFDMLVLQDRNTNSFSILPNKYIGELNYNNLKHSNTVTFKFPEKIDRNEFNMFGSYQFNMSDYANELIYQLKEFLLYNPQIAYEKLDDDLKKKKFRTYEKFCKYITDNYDGIYELASDNYTMEYKDKYSIYVFNSNNDNNFAVEIITQDVMEYKYKIL